MYLNDIDESGQMKYRFQNLSGKEIGRICEEIALKEMVKIKRRTFETKKIRQVQYGFNK